MALAQPHLTANAAFDSWPECFRDGKALLAAAAAAAVPAARGKQSSLKAAHGDRRQH